MCGVCGVVQIGGRHRPVVAPGVLERMRDAMAHRGPYDRGTYEDEGIAVGARRLPLVDIERGHQPFGLWILLLEIWLSSYLPRALGSPVSARERIRLS
jgi:asparagine synthetase B (glutamine-hydrolysing)